MKATLPAMLIAAMFAPPETKVLGSNDGDTGGHQVDERTRREHICSSGNCPVSPAETPSTVANYC